MHPTFKVIAYQSPDWTTAVKLREKVLREPLGAGFTEQELAAEQDQVQLAGFLDGTLIATAVLVPEGEALKMQRVAVAEPLRGLRIGSGLMAFCEQLARERQATSIYCHARDSAVAFYLKNGYEPIGDYFEEDGIPHLLMRKEL